MPTYSDPTHIIQPSFDGDDIDAAIEAVFWSWTNQTVYTQRVPFQFKSHKLLVNIDEVDRFRDELQKAEESVMDERKFEDRVLRIVRKAKQKGWL